MQLETILSVCGGRDTLALMPTGAGKSIIYQLPTIATDGFCVVITPLIALMKDQVDKLRERGISAVAVHSGMTPAQIDIALDRCVYGDVKFLYVAPERVASEVFRLRLPRMEPTLIAVDEAHCISQWGYDFRPSYLRIAELRTILPDVPFLAVTASATDAVAEDIMTQLRFSEDGMLLRSPFARPNLSYSVRHIEDKDGQLMRIINNVPGPGIVYVRTREGVEQLAATLVEKGVPATYYHGGMEAAERTIRQEEWTGGKKRVMVATNAFGMGIDKADVRFVVHYSICDSIENYYQETGRAGRDGHKAYAVLLTSPDDRNRAKNRFSTEYPSLEQIKNIYESLFQYLQVAVGEGKEYSFDFNVYEFCRAYRLFAWTVLNAIKILQSNGYVTLTDESDHPARVMFTVSRDDLYRLRVERDDLDHFLRVLLRMYNGLFTEFRSVSEHEIATVSGYTVDKVKEFFKTLWQLRVIRYIPSRRTPLIYFPVERLPLEDVYIAPSTYKIRKDLAAGRYEQMFAYAENTTECRSVWIQRYFGEPEPHDCGVCDVCLAKKHKGLTGVSPEAILQLIRGDGMTVKQIVAGFEASPEDVIQVIDHLVSDGKISVLSSGILKINR
jgi:ATP-dependent DNA helicase RecQ